jgi:3-methyladenine DNA glycosylase AlkC
MISIDRLRSIAENPNDPRSPKATNLIKEIERFSNELKSETESKIQQCLNDLTHVISQPDAVTVEHTGIADKIVKIGTAWGKAIDPQFGESAQVVG